MNELVIVGGGVAGAACALRAAQYHLQSVWVRGDKQTAKQSRSKWIQNVDNMIGVHNEIAFKRLRKLWRQKEQYLSALDSLDHDSVAHISTADMIDDVVDRLQDYSNHVRIIEAAATDARVQPDGTFEIDAGETLPARHVILATGVMDRQPLVYKERHGEVQARPNWVYPFANRENVIYCIRCEGHLTRRTQAAVIGHTDTAGQVALMLAERYDSVCCLLTNGEEPQLETDTQRLFEHYAITTRTGRIVDLSDAKGTSRAELRTITLEGGETLEVNLALVSLGLYRVYNDLARALGAQLLDAGVPEEQRHVGVNHRAETSVRNLFAVGDMTRREDEGMMKQIYTSQEYAVRAVDTIDYRRRKRRRDEILTGS